MNVQAPLKSEDLNTYRKRIIDFPKAIEIIEKSESMMHGADYPTSSLIVMELARNSNCSAYDCEYVALAKSKNLNLLTWDKAILKAFPEIAISPEKFLR